MAENACSLTFQTNSKLFLKIVLDEGKKPILLATEFAMPSIFGKCESVPYLTLCDLKILYTLSVFTYYVYNKYVMLYTTR